MDLLTYLSIPTDCYLCGCSVSTSSVKTTRSVGAPIICQDCHVRLPLSKNTCITCGLPLSYINSQNSSLSDKIPCGECLKNSPPFNRTISSFHYEQPISHFITKLKFSSEFRLLPLLCEYLLNEIKRQYQHSQLPESIIAIPLHNKKLRQRGFNQSLLIAQKLAHHLSIPHQKHGFYRVKPTQPQLGLDSKERKKNMNGAFKIDSHLPKHIAIVDDVVTTGTTVSELAKQARLHGAQKIDIWCLARAYEL